MWQVSLINHSSPPPLSPDKGSLASFFGTQTLFLVSGIHSFTWFCMISSIARAELLLGATRCSGQRQEDVVFCRCRHLPSLMTTHWLGYTCVHWELMGVRTMLCGVNPVLLVMSPVPDATCAHSAHWSYPVPSVPQEQGLKVNSSKELSMCFTEVSARGWDLGSASGSHPHPCLSCIGAGGQAGDRCTGCSVALAIPLWGGSGAEALLALSYSRP